MRACGWVVSLGLLTLAATGCSHSTAADPAVNAESAHIQSSSAQPPAAPSKDQSMEKATFAAGCFWGVEAAFRQVPGVTDATVGYTGGHTDDPTYKQVCSDRTGHAEAVEVVFDPAKVSYERLLEVFWQMHDPTTLNRQGPDVGSQYRSAIFYHTPAQRAAAEASRDRLAQSGKHRRPIVTEIVSAPTFWRAEEYHQRYFEKHGGASCHVK
jgi:peptide-methionine (S)-S-oxide reductase